MAGKREGVVEEEVRGVKEEVRGVKECQVT